MPVIFPLNLTQSPREIFRVEGNLEGRGKSRGRKGWISQYLPSFGGNSLIINHPFWIIPKLMVMITRIRHGAAFINLSMFLLKCGIVALH